MPARRFVKFWGRPRRRFPSPFGGLSLCGGRAAAWADHFEARRALDKMKRDDPLLTALAPVREAYRRLPNVQRGVLLAKVVAYIVR